MCVYMYVCVSIIYVHIYLQNLCVHLCLCIYLCIYVYICICIYASCSTQSPTKNLCSPPSIENMPPSYPTHLQIVPI